MRCCYRWTALTIFSAWILILQNASLIHKKNKWALEIIFGTIIIINLPNLPIKIREYTGYRKSFFELEHDWIDDMKAVVKRGKRVAFLPWRNDFLATYLAPRLGIATYNTGGDKNLAEARRHWPQHMREFAPEEFDPHFAERILHLLETGEADRVILPYVDFRWAAHRWPYPIEFKDEVQATIIQLRKKHSLTIEERTYYTSITGCR